MGIYEEWLREVDDDNLHNELISMDETAKENKTHHIGMP